MLERWIWKINLFQNKEHLDHLGSITLAFHFLTILYILAFNLPSSKKVGVVRKDGFLKKAPSVFQSASKLPDVCRLKTFTIRSGKWIDLPTLACMKQQAKYLNSFSVQGCRSIRPLRMVRRERGDDIEKLKPKEISSAYKRRCVLYHPNKQNEQLANQTREKSTNLIKDFGLIPQLPDAMSSTFKFFARFNFLMYIVF